MKKCQIKNSETSEISYISEIFRVFLFPSFWFCTTADIENLDLKILEKFIWDFWVFWIFSLACFDIINSKHTFDTWTERAQSYESGGPTPLWGVLWPVLSLLLGATPFGGVLSPWGGIRPSSLPPRPWAASWLPGATFTEVLSPCGKIPTPPWIRYAIWLPGATPFIKEYYHGHLQQLQLYCGENYGLRCWGPVVVDCGMILVMLELKHVS